MGNKKLTIGVALGSGGAKGLAHIGVLKTLTAHGIPIDYIAGSSIGALIGAFYAQNPNLDNLEGILADNTRRKSILLFDPIFRGGLIRGNKIEKYFAEILEGATFSSLKIPFAAVATNFFTADEVIITSGSLPKAIRASISVPGIFHPVEFDKNILVDGGLANPVPAKVVKDMGSDIVIAVNVESTYFTNPVRKIPSISRIPYHSINILRHNLTTQSLRFADIIISPTILPTGLIGWNYFYNYDKATTVIKCGESATLEKLPEILSIITDRKQGGGIIHSLFSLFRKKA